MIKQYENEHFKLILNEHGNYDMLLKTSRQRFCLWLIQAGRAVDKKETPWEKMRKLITKR